MVSTLFERCGGFATVRKVVSAFYDKVLESSALQKYFMNTDMRHLIDHQTKFVASLMGGPASYTDEVLLRVHAPLGITRVDFQETATLLRETLEDFELDEADVELVHREFLSRERLIVASVH